MKRECNQALLGRWKHATDDSMDRCTEYHAATKALQVMMSKTEPVQQRLQTVDNLHSLLSWLRSVIDLLEAETLRPT